MKRTPKKKLRITAIVEQADTWRRITSARAFVEHCSFYAEGLIRPPRGFAADHPLIEDLKQTVTPEMLPVLVSQFGLSEINWGIIPGGNVTRSVVATMNQRDAMYYVMTGRTFDGKKAAEIKLVNYSVPLANLREAGALSCAAIVAMPEDVLGDLVRPSGHFRVKARKLQSFCGMVIEEYGGDLIVVPERLFNF